MEAKLLAVGPMSIIGCWLLLLFSLGRANENNREREVRKLLSNYEKYFDVLC